MISLKWFLCFVLFCTVLCTENAFSQDPQIDKLEVFYDQGHYRRVVRRANRLLDKPDYDYSSVPKLFKSLALFKLTADETYNKRNPDAFNDAIRLFEIFVNQDANGRAYVAHRDKIIEVQALLAQKALYLKNKGLTTESKHIVGVLDRLFKDEMSLEQMAMQPVVETEVKLPDEKAPKEVSVERDAIIKYAEKYLGVKYKYGGTTEKGFDCSGYTSFVMKEFNIFLPRTSGEQYETVKKIKRNQVQKGDLVFYGSGKINHVGIIYSGPGEDLHMIHASTSVGISIVNIDQSSYWKPRIKGFGRVIKN